MGGQFHFDPDTYLAMVLSEVPAYRTFQAAVADATGSGRTRLLELGVGTGETTRRVLDRHPGAAVVGIDESEAMLDAARSVLTGVDLRVGRLQDRLPEGPFDLVVTALAVHHLDGPAKADLFARIHQVLAPGGRLVLGDVIVPEDPADVVTPIDGDHDQPSSLADQLAWLGAAGFTTEVTWLDRDLVVVAADRPS